MVKVITYFWLWVNIFLVYYTISYSKIILLTQNNFVVYIIKKRAFSSNNKSKYVAILYLMCISTPLETISIAIKTIKNTKLLFIFKFSFQIFLKKFEIVISYI
jgi:hypothetical protein